VDVVTKCYNDINNSAIVKLYMTVLIPEQWKLTLNYGSRHFKVLQPLVTCFGGVQIFSSSLITKNPQHVIFLIQKQILYQYDARDKIIFFCFLNFTLFVKTLKNAHTRSSIR
jgi:hypothetical protein